MPDFRLAAHSLTKKLLYSAIKTNGEYLTEAVRLCRCRRNGRHSAIAVLMLSRFSNIFELTCSLAAKIRSCIPSASLQYVLVASLRASLNRLIADSYSVQDLIFIFSLHGLFSVEWSRATFSKSTVLSLSKTIKKKSTFRAKAIRRELVY